MYSIYTPGNWGTMEDVECANFVRFYSPHLPPAITADRKIHRPACSAILTLCGCAMTSWSVSERQSCETVGVCGLPAEILLAVITHLSVPASISFAQVPNHYPGRLSPDHLSDPRFVVTRIAYRILGLSGSSSCIRCSL